MCKEGICVAFRTVRMTHSYPSTTHCLPVILLDNLIIALLSVSIWRRCETVLEFQYIAVLESIRASVYYI